jgi:ABC-type lipoprotein export system ATPase subunit
VGDEGVVAVSHERDIARHADRVITLADGSSPWRRSCRRPTCSIGS